MSNSQGSHRRVRTGTPGAPETPPAWPRPSYESRGRHAHGRDAYGPQAPAGQSHGYAAPHAGAPGPDHPRPPAPRAEHRIPGLYLPPQSPPTGARVGPPQQPHVHAHIPAPAGPSVPFAPTGPQSVGGRHPAPAPSLASAGRGTTATLLDPLAAPQSVAPDAPTLPHVITPTLEVPREGRAAARRAARAKRAAELDALRRLVPQALVIAVLAGGTTAFVAHDKEVRLSVDGRARSLHTFASDVDGLLRSEGLDAGPHDLVSPSPARALADGDAITFRRGRPVTLTLDGERHRVWTTARTVAGALRLLGVRAEGSRLSAARHTAIPLGGLDLEVRTERTVTILADGRGRTIRTNAATVRRAVEEAGIVLRGEDTTSVPPGSYPLDGQRVSVLRITGSKEVREEVTPFRTIERSDPTLFRGTRAVVRRGVLGVRRVTYALRTVNGVEQQPRKLSAETVREPVDQIEHVGTKPLPGSVGGTDGLNWKALAHCEAGGRPDAVDASGTHGGLYQFDTSTWQRLGGRGRPQDAPASEQTYRAKKLYVQRGASPWPVCGRKLHQ